MPLSAAELDALITDLTSQYWRLSREYSEIADEERKDETAETMTAIDDRITRIEKQRQVSGNRRARTAGAS